MNLQTNYMGLRLKNPLVAGASPLSHDVNNVRALEDEGISAVVMYSLFQEQIEGEADRHYHYSELGTYSFAESLTHAPQLDFFPRGPDQYLEHLARLKAAVDIPVIASLNGTSVGGWIQYARMMQEAGADALELNDYCIATDPSESASTVEDRYVELFQAVKETVSIPVAMKLAPFFSSLPNFAQRLDRAGLDGLVLFNRFYQPDIDLEMLLVVPDLVLSAPHEMRLPLRWIAILDPLVEASLAATTGIYGWRDVLKLMMAGADVTMLCAALLRQDFGIIGKMLDEITRWLSEHDYHSLQQLQGSMNHSTCTNPGAFERANYMRVLNSNV